MIRVLLVDDHSLMRSGMRIVMEKESDMEVVGEAVDGAQAVELAATELPDVITLDLGLPDRNGLLLIEPLREASPESRILVVTGTDDPATLMGVMQAGAHGYMVKMADIRDLIGAVRAVYQGRAIVNLTFNEQFAGLLTSTPSPHNAQPSALIADLTERELEVLENAALGYSNKQIAKRLFLSVKTIETYRSRLQKKLDLEDRAALVRFALSAGLIGSTAQD